MKKTLFFLIILFLTFSCGNKKEENAPVEIKPVSTAFGLGKVEPQGGISNLAAPVAGIVSELAVSTGSKVKEGDILMVLDNTDAQHSVSEINSRYAAQQKTVESAKLVAKQGSINLKETERKLRDSRELFDVGALSKESLLVLENDLESEKQNQNKLENDILLQEALLREISAQRSMRNEDLNRTSLRAPMDGTVLDVLPKKGEAVNRYETYLLLAPDAPLVVKAEIDEMFSGKIAVGQSCSIYLSGDNEPVAKGKIIRISPDLKKKSIFADSGQDFQDRRVREIEVSLDNDPQLLIDTKVECVVELK